MLEAVRGSGLFLLLSAGLFVPLEVLWPSGEMARRSRGSRALDVALLVAGALLLGALAPHLAALSRLSAQLPVARLAQHQPRGLCIVEVFVLSELLGYALHRAMHDVPGLWTLHAVHHSSTAMDWLSAWRQHPVDLAMQAIAAALPGALLGCPLSQFLALVLVQRLWTSLLHADVDLPLGWLEVGLATPRFHRVHHRSHGANFAATLPVLDWLMGTLSSAHRPANTGARRCKNALWPSRASSLPKA